MELRELPSVDELLRAPASSPRLPRMGAVAAARETLARAREEIAAGHDPGDLVARALEAAAAAAAPRLRRVDQRDRGRPAHEPRPRAARRRRRSSGSRASRPATRTSSTTSRAGARGSRHDHLAALLRRLTGAEDALVVNNNAAALLLALSALAEGREVIVSRGELIEIGDGFRIPDVLARSGARLVEVGTTNRTRAADYEAAVGPETALLLRVHQSNFRDGRLHRAPGAARARRSSRSARGVPLVDDLGSGSLVALRRRAARAGEPRRRRRPRRVLRRQAARRPAGRASSAAAPTSSGGCGAIRSSARCVPTS